MAVQNWSTITLNALMTTWEGFVLFLPKLVGSLIVFVIGWFLSVGFAKLISEILKRLQFDKIFERAGWKEALRKADVKVSPSEFLGAICKWTLVIVFLLASVEILGFVQFANFISDVIAWLPNLLVAIIIFIVAIIVADIVEKLIRASVKKMDIGYAGFLGSVVRFSIYTFAILAMLLQLGITPTIIDTLIKGFVGTVSISLGLAFGLGGKEAAAELIESLKKKLS
jgi:hypothetical protein